MKKILFEGTATALITPFTKDGVDFEAFDRLLDFQLAGGVNAVVVLGTTGEPATQTEQEKRDVLAFAVNKLKGKLPVIVGAGSNCTATAVENAKQAQRLGADGLLVVTPYYNKCTQQGLVEHFTAISKATALPIIAYNVPSRTGVNMLPETFVRIAELDNIVGIKEASGNMAQIAHLANILGDKAAIYSGDDGLTVPIMRLGGKGVISVASVVVPKFVAAMTRAYLEGDVAKASGMQERLNPLVEALFEEVNPIPAKQACVLLGMCQNILRLPLTPATNTTAERLKIELAKFAEL